MIIKVRLESITSNAGDTVNFSPAGVTCLVGGNNAGKSQTLTDIAHRVENAESQTLVVSGLHLKKPSGISREEAEQFLSETAAEMPMYGQSWAQPNYMPVASNGGQAMTVDAFQMAFTHGGETLGASTGFFFQHWTAGAISSHASSSLGHVPAGGGSPASPLHQLFVNGALEEELSALSYEAFEQYLTVDRANMDVRLRMGRVTHVPIPLLSHPTVEYARAVAALPSLMEQGDGVRSFLGLAMTVLTGHSQILLIDEPEAFLHPGQARALGRWLSVQAMKRDIQVVVSTHSRDFVLGLLDGGDQAQVRMVRIVRKGTTNRLHELPPEDIAATWNDPVLRYSNVLQGLFHSRVAVCESDADCRFYGAVLDQLAINTNRRSQADDILLVPSGGKDRMAALARSMLKLGVETHIFADFDVLDQKARIKNIVEAVGGTWTEEINADFRTFIQPVQQGDLWKIAKNQGINAVPSGESYSATLRLLSALDAMGVHVVPIGEMEDFDRSIGGQHGSPWVSAALEKGLHKTSDEARAVVENVLSPNSLAATP